MFLHLERLSSTELIAGVFPWEWNRIDLVPPECFSDKAARDAWINRPSTRYHVYSPYQGVFKTRRVTGQDGDESNPPVLMFFLAVDCDVLMTYEEALKYIAGFSIKPQWFEQTLSGHGRFIWIFEVPLRFPNAAFAKRFQRFWKDFLPLNKLPGVDEGALTTVSRQYTNGARWTKLSDDVIPESTLRGFFLKVSEHFNWKQRELGKVANLAEIKTELAKRYPRFAEWPGEFALESQGPTFWVEGSLSPKSAIVHETGIFTFSDHAAKPFYSWPELVGKEFCEQSENTRLGDAVKGIYYDGQKYFYQDMDGAWQDSVVENVRRKLVVENRLSTKMVDGEPSELDRALNHITMHNRVDLAQSCPFYPKGVFYRHGKKILNMHTRDVIQPAAEDSVWGKDGKFPVLSAFLDDALTSREQLDLVLARWKREYVGCLNRCPEQGQGLIICGDAGLGKTFLSRALIGYSLGGFAEAGSYFTSSDGFNSELFDVALWVVDDGTSLSSDLVHRIFSEKLKQSVANGEHRCNEKFRKAGMNTWEHLIILTCNRDPESLRGIPSLDISSRDKLIIVLMNPDSKFVFPPKHEMQGIIEREMPYLLRWLINWVVPAHVTEGADSRFGIRSYCEPSLLRAANQSTQTNGFYELLTKWLREHFFAENDAAYWEGTSTDLRLAMSNDPLFAELLRGYKQEQFGRLLAQIQSKGMLKMTINDLEHERTWRIERDERFSKKRKPPTTPPQGGESKFEKAP